MNIAMRAPLTVRDDEESGPFEEQHFIRVYNLREMIQMFLQFLNIRYKSVDDCRPGLIQSLIPYRRPKTGAVEG